MRVAIAGSTGLIGTKLVKLARSDGHDVVEVSRSSGFDLTDEAVLPRLAEALADVDAVVDVTQGASFEEDEAVSFFRSVAGHLGQAAHEAGVRRTVVLSIVGIEESPDYGYYVGKVAQEKAHRENSPGVLVLRATQFHEFPGQMVEWFTTDGVADVMDVEFQPVDSAEVVRLLLEMATGSFDGDVQLAGPRTESLVGLAREHVAAKGLDATVKPGEAPASMAEGGMLPRQEDAVIVRGRSWHEWMDQEN